MEDLLIQLEQRLPPELLRIIAVKYRRTIEIKPQLCPEAITQQPIHKERCTKYIYDTYLIHDYTFQFTQIEDYADIYIYETEDPDRHHYMTINYYKSKDLLDCRKKLHHKPFPIEILIASLILFKRYGNTVTGDTTLSIIERSLHETIFIKKQNVRDTLYKDPTLWNS